MTGLTRFFGTVCLCGAVACALALGPVALAEPAPKAKPVAAAEDKPAGKKARAAKQDTKQEAKQDKAEDAKPEVKKAKTYTKDYVGEMQAYVAKYEDTMVQIARTYNVGFVELRSANPFLDPWIPGAGKKIVIPTMHLLPRAPREGVVMNLAEMRMYVFLKPGQPPTTFPIGIGREGLLTPSGTTSVVRKKDGPQWRPTARMRKENPALPALVEPGPDNPMGTHALYLGWPEYAIHGTDKPYSIGRRSSSGCIRMYPENIVQVYASVPVGTPVTVVNQSLKIGWLGNKLYLEAHPTMEQADRMEVDGGLPGYVFPEEDMGMIVASAGEYARDLDWSLIRQIIRERRGYPVEIFRKDTAKKEKEAPADTLADAADAVAASDVPVTDNVAADKAEAAPKRPMVTPN